MARIHLGVLGLFAATAVVAFVAAPSSGRFERDAVMILCAVLAIIWHLALTGPQLGAPGATGPLVHADPTVRANPSTDDEVAARGEEDVAGRPESDASQEPATHEPEPAPQAEPSTPSAVSPEPGAHEPAEVLHRPGYFDLPGAEPAIIDVHLSETWVIVEESPAAPAAEHGAAPEHTAPEDTAPEDGAEVELGPPSVAQLWPPEGVEIPRVFLDVDEPKEPTEPTGLPPIEEVIDLRVDGVAEAPPERSVPTPPEPTASVRADDREPGEDPWLAFAAAMFRDRPE